VYAFNGAHRQLNVSAVSDGGNMWSSSILSFQVDIGASVTECTVNQLLFAATLFRDSSVIKWLVASNFCDRAFCILRELYKTSGSRREIFAAVRCSWNFLAHE
jgi:hypothetical protein